MNLVTIFLGPCYVGPCHHAISHPWVVDGGDGFHIRRVPLKILTKQSQTTNKERSSSFGVGAGD